MNEREQLLLKKLSSDPRYKQAQERVLQAIHFTKNKLQQDLANNADYQRRGRMTEEERRREAIEVVAQNRVERARFSGNACPSFEKAREESEQLSKRLSKK